MLATFIRLAAFLFGEQANREMAESRLNVFAHEDEEQLKKEAETIVKEAKLLADEIAPGSDKED